MDDDAEYDDADEADDVRPCECFVTTHDDGHGNPCGAAGTVYWLERAGGPRDGEPGGAMVRCEPCLAWMTTGPPLRKRVARTMRDLFDT